VQTLAYSTYLSGNGTDRGQRDGYRLFGQYYYVTGDDHVYGCGQQYRSISGDHASQPIALSNHFASIHSVFRNESDSNFIGARSIAYSTYFGGATYNTPTPIAVGGGIAVDTAFNVYFTGTTNFLYTGVAGSSNTDFPI